ncbi:MAG: tol-pal system-associated acyl-CoA thioesterase [Maritimibacter harenae]|jgi:acyl-CoA thioester hydrolase|uniref:Tol-pal system-associated acyl-CoA thioesterase n=1 Tax=Maritimibacter harenae TaxID=2606218 RepID=A0A845M3G7_9RHOB|nr:tol-pal system-associated acyl-CoA thioesterase [Maritimibacter harenae]MZR14106.1 tol-pal system-associated acyl-CoA thioesterase [Maritimibacter harenae]
MTHRFPVHVYYEDTDLAGIVYYANYLRFIERARTEWIRERGVDQTRVKEETGVVFAVRHLEADYLAPAKFDDDLTVETEVVAMTGARIVLKQDVKRDGDVLFASTVTIVALTETGAPARLPAIIRQSLH